MGAHATTAVNAAAGDREGRTVEAMLPFLSDVLSRDGYLVLAEVKKTPAPHDSYTSIEDLVQALTARRDTPDLYFATASFRDRVGPYKGRTQANVLARRTYHMDIDAGPGKRFANRREVLVALRAAMQQGMPAPTHIVGSGGHGGVHLYWCLSEDIRPDQWKPVAKLLHAVATKLGMDPDPAVTSDEARVLRAPGSINGKTGRRAALLTSRGAIYTPAEFADALAALAPSSTPPARKTATVTPLRPMNAEVVSSEDGARPPPAVTSIIEACPAMERATRDQGAATPEPYWRAALGVLKHTAEGADAAHHYSRGHPGYSEAETQAKFDGWTAGPTTCAEFGRHSPESCATCPHSGKIKSPIVLGRRAEVTHLDPAAEADATTEGEADAAPSDLALATIWVRKYGDRFKFDHSRRGWMHWRGGAWSYCTKEQHVESFKQMAGGLLRAAGDALQRTGGGDQAKRHMAIAMRAHSATGTRSALNLAQSDPAIAVSFEEFDQDPDLFNVANGVVHLPTGKLRPHDPALMLHRQSPVAYDLTATCPLWLKFLGQVSCGDPEWVRGLQTSLGYACSGYVTEEKAHFWLGIGANGKTVAANTVHYIMGTYAAVAPSAFLMQSKRDAGGATPELAMLPGVRMLSANEIEAGARASGQTIKVAVSTEPIAARAVYGQPFSFRPTHKLFIRGNHRPIIADDDEGIWRRIVLVPFDLNLAPEDRDQSLEARLLAEAPGILRWMVEGFAVWRREGLRLAKRVRDASLAYRRDSDVMGQWLDDACEVGQGFTVAQRFAYFAYRQWAGDQGLRVPAKKTFTRNLKERGIGEARASSGTREHTYTGIRLKP